MRKDTKHGSPKSHSPENLLGEAVIAPRSFFLCLIIAVPAAAVATLIASMLDAFVEGIIGGGHAANDSDLHFVVRFFSCGLFGFLFVWFGALLTPKIRGFSVWVFASLAVAGAIALGDMYGIEGLVGQCIGAVIGGFVFHNLGQSKPSINTQSKGKPFAFVANSSSQETRMSLVRRLVAERFEADPQAKQAMVDAGHTIEGLPDQVIMSTPEANIVRIAERLIAGRRKGLEDEHILFLIHREFQEKMGPESPYPFPPRPDPLTIWTYTDYFLECQHPNSAKLTNAHIDHVFNETYRFYNYFGMQKR